MVSDETKRLLLVAYSLLNVTLSHHQYIVDYMMTPLPIAGFDANNNRDNASTKGMEKDIS
jgi:hypothetical protein